MSEIDPPAIDPPKAIPGGRTARGALNAVGGAVPIFGGLLAAAASAWSEHEQDKVNRFLRAWIEMLRAQIEEQQATIAEVMTRLDMHDEKIAERIESKEYQSLVRKAFRDWAGAESEEKRAYVRNVLANAATTGIVSDDVVRLFLDWLRRYSELHFKVVGVIYNQAGVTRGDIWEQIGRGPVREDSADADLFKLLIRDLSTGGIIRQHRETDYAGNFVAKSRPQQRRGSGARPVVSAFDESETYELTQLGQQFVHYAMVDLPPKIEFKPASETADPANVEHN